MIYDFCGSAAVQGSFHRKRQLACTDSAAARTKGDYALLICADGARAGRLPSSRLSSYRIDFSRSLNARWAKARQRS